MIAKKMLLWGDKTSQTFCFHRCSISLKRCYNLDLAFQVNPKDRSTFLVSKMCKGFIMKRFAQTEVGIMGEVLQVANRISIHSCCCYYGYHRTSDGFPVMLSRAGILLGQVASRLFPGGSVSVLRRLFNLSNSPHIHITICPVPYRCLTWIVSFNLHGKRCDL